MSFVPFLVSYIMPLSIQWTLSSDEASTTTTDSLFLFRTLEVIVGEHEEYR